MCNTFAVYFQIFATFGYKKVKNSDHPAPSRAPNRQICSRDPPPSIPEPVDESILSPDKFVIKPDVIRIAVLLTEVGEGIFTARSRVARFAVSLNE